MLLERRTWQEVEAYLERSRGVILPVGSTEQHGPSGLMGTDALCAELIARGVGEATGAMIAPTLNFGMAQHHMAFCGTMTLRPETLLAVLVDLLGSLAQHGFQRCLVINGHGGNTATIMAAFSELHAKASLTADRGSASLCCRLRNWWSPPPVTEVQKELFGDRDGSHATASEISLTQYALPKAIKRVEFEPRLCAGEFRLHRRGRLPPPLPRRPHGLRPVACRSGPRRAAVPRRGRRSERGLPEVSGRDLARAGRHAPTSVNRSRRPDKLPDVRGPRSLRRRVDRPLAAGEWRAGAISSGLLTPSWQSRRARRPTGAETRRAQNPLPVVQRMGAQDGPRLARRLDGSRARQVGDDSGLLASRRRPCRSRGVARPVHSGRLAPPPGSDRHGLGRVSDRLDGHVSSAGL